jgi:hypothetical protein
VPGGVINAQFESVVDDPNKSNGIMVFLQPYISQLILILVCRYESTTVGVFLLLIIQPQPFGRQQPRNLSATFSVGATCFR